MHRLLVASKYASLSKTEYQRFIECSDITSIETYQQQMSLISAWLRQNERVFIFELGCASVRCGVSLKNMSLSIPKLAVQSDNGTQLLHWNALLRGHYFLEDNAQLAPALVLQADGSYRVSLNELLKALFLKANRCYFTNDYMTVLVWSATLINCMIPLAFAARFVIQHGSPSFWYYCYHISSTIVVFSFSFVIYELLFVAVFDAARLLYIFLDLADFIRLNNLLLPIKFPSRLGKDYSKIESDRALRHRSDIFDAVNVKVGSSMGVHANDVADMRESDSNADRSSSWTVNEDFLMNSIHNTSFSGQYQELADDVAFVPKLALADHQNILGWTFARLAVQNFGKRFRFRLDIYTGNEYCFTDSLLLSQML